MAIPIRGNSGTVAEVNPNREQLVALTADPTRVGGIRMFSENDAGDITGEAYNLSPETDDDHRLRTSNDTVMDTETFNYTAQNTGKHTYGNATMTVLWTTGGLVTNGGAVTTTGLGVTFGTYAEFSVVGTQHLYAEFEGGFTAQPTANVVIDFGMFRRGASAAYAPTDGVCFRLGAAGMYGVVINNTVETQVGPFNFSYINGRKYQFIISINQREVKFWIDNVLYARLETPVGQGQPFMSATLPMSIRHAHVGTAGGVVQFLLNNYTVTVGGSSYAEPLGQRGNAVYGSYQGLSGQTMGQLVSGTVTTGTLVKPSAVVPANNALTAGLCNSLGGRSWETLTTGLAVNTDGVLQAFQVPAGTVSIPGRRLKIRAVKMTATVQTVVVGGPVANEFYLCFGGTAISLQTAEGVAAKVARRVFLPELTQIITAAQAVSTMVAQPVGGVAYFEEPIYVNPGEYVMLVVNRMGTALTSGVIAYNIQYDYSWE